MHHSPKNRGHMLTTKNVHFVKLSKCETDFTVTFLSTRRSKTYMECLIRSPDEEVMPSERCLVVGTSDCRKFRRVSGLPESLKKSARVSGVIPTSGVPTQVGTSNPSRDFRLDFWHTWQKILFGSGLLDSNPNCSKLMENLENKAWRGFLLG